MMDARSGKMPTTSVRRRISRLSRSLGLLDQIWRQISFGNAVKARDVGPGALEVLGHRRELLTQGVDDPVELGVHRLGVGLVVDRMQQRLDPAPPRLGSHGHQVGGVVSAALKSRQVQVEPVVVLWGGGVKDWPDSARISQVDGATVVTGHALPTWAADQSATALKEQQIADVWTALDAQVTRRDPIDELNHPVPASIEKIMTLMGLAFLCASSACYS